jgi:hypothetical protein
MPICTNLAKFKCIKLSRFEKTFFIRLLRIFSSFLMDFQNFEIMNNKFGRFMNLGKQIECRRVTPAQLLLLSNRTVQLHGCDSD